MRRYISLLFPLVFIASGFTLPPQQTPEKAAQEAAESWLRLIDAGKYGESWDELAEVTKAKVPKASWEKLQNDATPTDAGEGRSRALSQSKVLDSLIGLTDRAGVMLQYRVRLDSHRSVEELLELVREPERGWRVAFYMKTATTLLFDPTLRAGTRDELNVEPQMPTGDPKELPRPEPLRPGTGGGIGAGSDSGPAIDSSGRNIGMTAVDERPVPLNAPQPRYTQEARDNKVQGVVILRVLVGADGAVKQVKIVRGLPDGLDEQAVQAAYQLRFKPAMKGGKPVAFWQSVSIGFYLK